MENKVRRLIERFEELESEMGRPDVVADQEKFTKINKAWSALREAHDMGRAYLLLCADRMEWQSALQGGGDAELQAAARSELQAINSQMEEMEKKLQILMVPRDPWDNRNAILEIRGGTGGDESALFVGDLFRMYKAYFDRVNWRAQVLELSEGTAGGYKEAKLLVSGDGVYGSLKFESGVHRVQRVPATESQGRVHTSAATVAVLPEAEEVDVEIREADLKVDTYRASGAGGQHINKTDSAIRITHIPTGTVVACQQERSQHKNRAKALEELRSRLLDRAIAEQQQTQAASRKAQVGTGDRSAKIRTYNYPQNRVTDHRINFTLYQLESFVAGDLQEMLEALAMADAQEKMSQDSLA